MKRGWMVEYASPSDGRRFGRGKVSWLCLRTWVPEGGSSFMQRDSQVLSSGSFRDAMNLRLKVELVMKKFDAGSWWLTGLVLVGAGLLITALNM
jgi:hypothetical protein